MPEKEVLSHLEKQRLFAGKDLSNRTLVDYSEDLKSRGDSQSNRGRRWTNSNGKEDYIRLGINI